MPAHSSHLLQPLDVGCFAPLKKAYSRQIENLVRSRITHISKEAFIPAFVEAFKATMTKANIQGGFKGAGLVLYDLEVVISQLDIKLFTPTPKILVQQAPIPRSLKPHRLQMTQAHRQL